MQIKWNPISEGYPLNSSDLEGHIFIVTNGKEMTLAKWVNLCREDHNCGADWDEYEFFPLEFMEIKYWYGPIDKK